MISASIDCRGVDQSVYDGNVIKRVEDLIAKIEPLLKAIELNAQKHLIARKDMSHLLCRIVGGYVKWSAWDVWLCGRARCKLMVMDGQIIRKKPVRKGEPDGMVFKDDDRWEIVGRGRKLDMVFTVSPDAVPLILLVGVLDGYLLWLNYKWRIVYGCFEYNGLWRWFDEKSGWVMYLSFVLQPLGLFAGLVAVRVFLGEVWVERFLAVLFGFLIINVYVDSVTLSELEKCLKCPSATECLTGPPVPSHCKIPRRSSRDKMLRRLRERGLLK